MARKSKASLLGEIHAEAIKRFETLETRERKNRTMAVDDIKFCRVDGGQWEEEARERRKNQPIFTINRVAPAVDQIVGDQRQSRARIKVVPAGGEAEEDTAAIYDGLIRNIEAQSQAENAYDNGFDEAVTGGYGGWRITTEYATEETFNQDIKIRPITSATTSLYFGEGEAYDKRDAKYAFYTRYISTEDFKAKYPDANVSGFQQQSYSTSNTWFKEGEVRIAEYWRKVPETKKIALLSDGRVIDLDEDGDALAELAFKGIEVVKERKVNSHYVEMYVMNGMEILSGAQRWAGKYIPLIPVYGKITYAADEVVIKGIVRDAKDPARIYNYATSAVVEAAALSPKDPYWLTPKMVGSHKAQFENFNTRNSPFMLFEPDERVGNQPPVRTGAPSVQQGLMGIINQAAVDIEATTGLHAASMGNAPQLLSEKSVQSQAEKGDRGMFIFSDNLAKSIRYTGDILVDLIPRIMDAEMMVSILGEDGTREILKINERAFDEFNQVIVDPKTRKEIIINDLSRGKYDVEVVTAPAYGTKKKESLTQLIELTQASEEFASISGDLIAKSLDVIDSPEIAKRMRKIYIQKGIAEPTEEEAEEMELNKPQEPSPEQSALIENINSETQKNMMAMQKDISEINQKAVNSMETMIDAYKKQLEAGVPISMEQQEALLRQTELVMMTQEKLAGIAMQ